MENPLGRLLEFLDQLDEAHIHSDLKHSRDTIAILADLPTGFWEIEFFEDGTLEVELFPRTADGVKGVPEEWLDQFIKENTD
jgi:hypothetical protein